MRQTNKTFPLIYIKNLNFSVCHDCHVLAFYTACYIANQNYILARISSVNVILDRSIID